MKSSLTKKISIITVMLFIGVLIPGGAAQAFISSDDYYSTWNSFKTTQNVNTEPSSGTNESNSNTNQENSNYINNSSSDSDYYSRYFNFKNGQTYSNNPDTSDNNNDTSEPVDNGDNSILTSKERQLLEMTNQERQEAGLSSYSVDSELVELARKKSKDMYENNYFSHTSPTYGSAYDMEKDAGISARVMGAENIAKAATVKRAHNLFMNSDGHRANILDSRHDTIGIGIVDTPEGLYVTQLFLGD